MNPSNEYELMEVVRNYLFIERKGLERNLRCIQHMLKTMYPEEATKLTLIRVKTMLGKMVTDNLILLHKEKYELTTMEENKIIDFRNRPSKKGLQNQEQIFPRLTKVKHLLKGEESDDEEKKKTTYAKIA